MITCERCKTENLEGSQYCDECGAPLKPNPRSSSGFSGPPIDGNGSKAAAASPQRPEDADGGVFPDVDLDADDPEAKVSRRHARVTLKNGEYFVEDLGSTNGTFLNRGKRLLPGQPQPLRESDEIIVGKTFLRFHIVK